MNDGKHCPACGTDIGFWPVFWASQPDRISCPTCKAHLAYVGVRAVQLIIVLVLLILIAIGGILASRVDGALGLVSFILVMLAGWVLVEATVTRYVRANK